MGWKTVRDNHQKILENLISGQWRTAPDPVSSLIKKLGEEYSELVEDRDPSEFYDVLDVLWELVELMDFDRSAARVHSEKYARLGGFRNHVEWHPNPSVGLNQDATIVDDGPPYRRAS